MGPANKPKLYTIEGNEGLYQIAKDNYHAYIRNPNCEVNFIHGLFRDKLPGILQTTESLDLLYIDGDHQKQATLLYFNWCAEKANPKSIFIFDDIYWSQGMKEAWQEITQSPKVTLCLDLYRLGIVFFNPGLSRQVIRIR